VARRKSDAEKQVSQARSRVKEIRRKSKAILKRAQIDVREYRKEISTLKKQGIVAKYINAKTHQPTRYMVSKLKRFKDVATGHAMAVPASKLTKERAAKYVKKGTARKVGRFLVLPKTAAKQRADVIKGHLATYTELGFGEERIIFLPFEAKNLNDVVAQLEDHESEINQLKERNEQFGFQLFGHNAKRGFVDAEDLHKYLTQNYSHLLSSPLKAQQAFQEFVLIRFKHRQGMPQMEPYRGTRFYGPKNKRRPDTYWEQELRKRATARKAKQRERETIQQRIVRLGNQRAYDRKKAEERREKRMFEKLMK